MATQQFGSAFEVLPYPNNYIELYVEQTIGILHFERALRTRKAREGNVVYGQVTNKEDVPWTEHILIGTAAQFPRRVATAVNTLVALAPDQTFGTMGDIMQPGPEILYLLACGFYSDREVEIAIRHGGTTGQLYGLKRAADQRITPSVSPYKRPRITLRSYGDQFAPTIFVRNPTNYVCGVLKMSLFGHKYEIEELKDEPDRVDKWISIRQIPET